MGKARATVTYMSNLNVGADQKHHDARTEVPVAPRGRERLKEREKEPEVLTSDLSLHSCVSGMRWNDQPKSRVVLILHLIML